MKRGRKLHKIVLNGKLKNVNAKQLRFLEKKEQHQSRIVKRTFYIFLDIIILFAFSMSLYFTTIGDYTKTILFLAIGSLLLLFFVIKRILKC